MKSFVVKMFRSCVLIACVAASSISAVHAQVVIDFETLAPNSLISTQYPSATFSSSVGNENAVQPYTSGQILCTRAIGGPITCVEDTYIDFNPPVGNLTFVCVEPNCACVVATLRVFVNGFHTSTLSLMGLGSLGSMPVDLSAFSGITRLEIVGILNSPQENGVGWDDFQFTPQSPGTPLCSGDGSAATCPCGNTGAVARGCGNSLSSSGGMLTSVGVSSIAADSLVLRAIGVPDGPSLYFQATTVFGSGNGVTFGDGLRCAGGIVVRLGIVTSASNTSQYPTILPPTNVPISVRGSCAPGFVGTYQVWYRDSDPTYCMPATFNLTNGYQLAWVP